MARLKSRPYRLEPCPEAMSGKGAPKRAKPGRVGHAQGTTTYNGAVKRHLLHSFGLAFLLASPIWLTMSKPPKYLNFALSAAIGLLLLVLRAGIPETKKDGRVR